MKDILDKCNQILDKFDSDGMKIDAIAMQVDKKSRDTLKVIIGYTTKDGEEGQSSIDFTGLDTLDPDGLTSEEIVYDLGKMCNDLCHS